MSSTQGNSGAGKADKGSPVKTGGVYNATQPTYTDGQRADHQTDSRGNAMVALAAGSNIAGYVNINEMPGSVRTIDTVSAAVATDKIMNNRTEVTPVFVFQTLAAGSVTVGIGMGAPGTGAKSRIFALYATVVGAATDLTIASNGVTKFKASTLTAPQPLILPFNPLGWFESGTNEAFTATTTTGTVLQLAIVFGVIV